MNRAYLVKSEKKYLFFFFFLGWPALCCIKMFHLHAKEVSDLLPTPSVINGFDHEWRVYLPKEGIQYEPSENPPPFEAYGKNCHFVLEKCFLKGCKQCYTHTIKSSEKEVELKKAIFENYSVLFGIKRNKALSIQVKKNKAYEMESESSSSEEEKEKDEEEEEESEEEEEQIIEEGEEVPEEEDVDLEKEEEEDEEEDDE